jgi:XTP/dITP diphosphohydrolase
MNERWATFKTVAVVISPEGEEYSFEGSVRGVILPEPQAPSQPHMSYSGIFRPFSSDKVFARMTVDEENAISHRGKAFVKVRDFLEKVPWFKAL